MNVWSTTASLRAADGIFALPIPFESEWPTSFTRYAVSVFADAIIAAAIDGMTRAQFIRRLVSARFERLPKEHLALLSAPPAENVRNRPFCITKGLPVLYNYRSSSTVGHSA